MNKKVLIIVAAVLAVVIIAGVIVVANSFAPDFNYAGTYEAEDGTTAVVTKDSIEFSTGEKGKIEIENFSFEYLGSVKNNEFMIGYMTKDDGNGSVITFHSENGKLCFSTYEFGDLMQFDLVD